MTTDLRALVDELRVAILGWGEDMPGVAMSDFLARVDGIEAALDAQAGGWLPIESAPRYGLLLTFHPRFGQRVMRPDPVSAGWFLDDTGDATQSVTHWMPLPAGPVEGGEG